MHRVRKHESGRHERLTLYIPADLPEGFSLSVHASGGPCVLHTKVDGIVSMHVARERQRSLMPRIAAPTSDLREEQEAAA